MKIPFPLIIFLNSSIDNIKFQKDDDLSPWFDLYAKVKFNAILFPKFIPI